MKQGQISQGLLQNQLVIWIVIMNTEFWSCCEIDFLCYMPNTSRAYDLCCLNELIVETKRLPNKKVLQFDNVWFVKDITSWSWSEVRNLTTKVVRRICDFQLGLPHRTTVMKKQLTLEIDVIKDNNDTLKRQEHDSNFLV